MWGYTGCSREKFLQLSNYRRYRLLELLEKIDDTKDISTQILEAFKKTILYVGKGIKGRKLDHLIEGKKIILKQLKLSKICAKYSKITQIWERGHGIVCC